MLSALRGDDNPAEYSRNNRALQQPSSYQIFEINDSPLGINTEMNYLDALLARDRVLQSGEASWKGPFLAVGNFSKKITFEENEAESYAVEHIHYNSLPLYIPRTKNFNDVYSLAEYGLSRLLKPAIEVALAHSDISPSGADVEGICQNFYNRLKSQPWQEGILLREKMLETAKDVLGEAGIGKKQAEVALSNFEKALQNVKIREVSLSKTQASSFALGAASLIGINSERIEVENFLDDKMSDEKKQECLLLLAREITRQSGNSEHEYAARLREIAGLFWQDREKARLEVSKIVQELPFKRGEDGAVREASKIYNGMEICLPAVDFNIESFFERKDLRRVVEDEKITYLDYMFKIKAYETLCGFEAEQGAMRKLIEQSCNKIDLIESESSQMVAQKSVEYGKNREFAVNIKTEIALDEKTGEPDFLLYMPVNMLNALDAQKLYDSKKDVPVPKPAVFEEESRPEGWMFGIGLGGELGYLFADETAKWYGQEGFIPQKKGLLEPTMANFGYVLSLPEVEKYPAEYADLYLRLKYGSVVGFATSKLEKMLGARNYLSADEVLREAYANIDRLVEELTGKTINELDALAEGSNLREMAENLIRSALFDYAIERKFVRPGSADWESIKNAGGELQKGRTAGSTVGYVARTRSHSHNIYAEVMGLCENFVQNMKNHGFLASYMSKNGATKFDFFLALNPHAKSPNTDISVQIWPGVGAGVEFLQRLYGLNIGSLPGFSKNGFEANIHIAGGAIGGSRILSGRYGIGGEGFISSDAGSSYLPIFSGSFDINSRHVGDFLKIDTKTRVYPPLSWYKELMPPDFRKGFEETGPELQSSPTIISVLNAQTKMIDILGQKFRVKGGGGVNWSSGIVNNVYFGANYPFGDGKNSISINTGMHGITENLYPFVSARVERKVNDGISAFFDFSRSFLPYGRAAGFSSVSAGVSLTIPVSKKEEVWQEPVEFSPLVRRMPEMLVEEREYVQMAAVVKRFGAMVVVEKHFDEINLKLKHYQDMRVMEMQKQDMKPWIKEYKAAFVAYRPKTEIKAKIKSYNIAMRVGENASTQIYPWIKQYGKILVAYQEPDDIVLMPKPYEYEIKTWEKIGTKIRLRPIRKPIEPEEKIPDFLKPQQAELVVTLGKIDNFGFGWPPGFDYMEGKKTPIHPHLWIAPPGTPPGLKTPMVGSRFFSHPHSDRDSYSIIAYKLGNVAQPLIMEYKDRLKDINVKSARLEMFVDDFQSASGWLQSRFQIKLNGRRAPFLESIINSLDQG
ncbi:MAG: hypothetical protein ABIH83_02050, partial [Candidatus Micrarchaeota archaeon]